MLKNTASQSISALILDKAGDPVTTGTTTVYVCGDGGTQASGGTATHEGNGVWSFLPSQANTNYDEISFLFTSTATDAVNTNLTVFTTPETLATAAALTTVDTVVDGIQTDLSNATDGLGAIKGAVDTIDGIVDDVLVDTGTTLPASIATIDTEVGTIQTDLDNATDGLGAIKTAVDSRMAEASINTTAGAVDTVTTNTDMRGTDNAALASALSTAQTDLDTLTGADGAIIASAQTVATATNVTNQVSADVTAISGSTNAADNLEASALGIESTTVTGTPNSTSLSLTAGSNVDDTYIDRVIVMTSGTNAGLTMVITDYAQATKLCTYAATATVSSGDNLVIV